MGGSGGNNLGGIGWWDWKGSNMNGSVVKRGGGGVISWGSVDKSGWGMGIDGSSVRMSKNWGVDGGMSDSNWSGQSGNWGWSDWEVGSGHTESVDWISNIVHALDQSMSINVRVSTTSDTISSPGLLLGGWTTSITVTVLAELILGMVLGGMAPNNRGWGKKSSLGDSQSGSENNKGTHIDF
jgi:hypothetical protein